MKETLPQRHLFDQTSNEIIKAFFERLLSFPTI